MTTHSPAPAPRTTTAPGTEDPPRGWQRLLPDPTPADLLPQARPMPAWAAYAAFLLIYVLVFGYPLLGIVMGYLAGGTAPLTPAPDADTFWQSALPGWIMHVVLLAITGLSAWLVAWRRRLRVTDLFAPAWVRTATGAERTRSRRQGRRVFALALAGLVVWMVGGWVLAAVVPSAMAGGFAIDTRADAAWTAAMLGPTQITTALVEEVVVVALLVVVLGAARRPAAEVYTVAVVAKLAYHAYYGFPVLAMVPAAVLMVWLYRRTGRAWPIITAHAAYNVGYSALIIAWPPVAAL
ncbi:hypothetical protein CLV63_11292 [Murinocardiopsis flavida]|uniref:CAAX prenyl protease 2/Lysostaphin resistance protein A-like domain-containing protein n=1 Tax=Murinocardiopsis flavida TaxID=645275 RepID=A0A2P8DG75_9ACTN|nr:CPBP family glutamic-type intramembrane protease [Murinocardiopsis flavida]PSK96210.1 hypothetical protein CLV63_11292 [Murinocardiopsis flavida]